MALSIGVSAGSRIKVGGKTVHVRKILTPVLLVLTVDDGDEILVSDKERVKIMPDVFVFAGVGSPKGDGQGVGNRLAFEAPRSIAIHRLEGRGRDASRIRKAAK